jgi:transposase
VTLDADRIASGPPATAAVVIIADQLLVTGGANPDRLHGDAALAALCGTSPVEASSGRTSRHRLNRGGDRAANNALWVIANVRTISDPRTRAFVAKRTATGNSRKEIMHMLQRYIARKLSTLIIDALRSAFVAEST